MANRRRTLGLKIVNNAQRYFVIFEFILLMLTMLYLLYLVFGTINGVISNVHLDQTTDLGSVFDEINFLILVRVAILFVVVFLINIILGLFFLHRLVGPLVRIRNIMSQIADGNIPSRDIVLRKGDYPTDLAEELSRVIQVIRDLKNKSEKS